MTVCVCGREGCAFLPGYQYDVRHVRTLQFGRGSSQVTRRVVPGHFHFEGDRTKLHLFDVNEGHVEDVAWLGNMMLF